MRHEKLTPLSLAFLLLFPSPACAQLARSVRPAPAAPAPVTPLPGGIGSAPALSAPTLSAPAAPSLLPNPALPIAAVGAAAPSARAVPLGARAAAPAAAQRPAAARALPAPEAGTAAAPGEVRETSADRLDAISRSRTPGALWTGGRVRPAFDVPVSAFERTGPAPARSRLSRSNAVSAPREEPGAIAIPRPTAASRVRDWIHYTRITGSSLYWYTFPRLLERWSELAESLEQAAGRPRAVRRIMAFFIAHRVLGSTGSYAPMGFRVAANQTVVDDAWRIYRAYFPDGSESREAFARLIERALRFNPNRRSTQFRKVVFHALREASTKRPEELPAYFDSLATAEKAADLAAYQAAEQGKVLERFNTLTEQVILELNRGLPAGRRLVGAVLLGSFANGAAGPGSDLDVQTLSEDGRATYNAEFLKRLKALWKSEGYPAHPVSGFEYGLPLSRELLSRVHREPYLVVSPYPEVRQAMSIAPETMKGHETRRGLRGAAFVVVYSGVLFGVLAAYEAWRRIRGAIG